MTSAWFSSSKRDKDRLYLALYARGGPGYHWAFITGPKPEKELPTSPGMRIHAIQRANLIIPGANTTTTSPGTSSSPAAITSSSPATATAQPTVVTQWEFQAREITMAPTAMVLVRLVIAKITNMDKLLDILSSVPMRPGDKDFDCRGWIRDSLKALQQDGAKDVLSEKSKILDWTAIHAAIINYVERKKAEHRFDGCAQLQDAEGNDVAPAWSNDRIATFDLLTGKEVFP